MRRKRDQLNISNTWWLFVCLCITYFLFRWNLIYSISTATPCQSLSDYWLISGDYFPGLYGLFLLSFILFAAWSVTEMLSAVAADKGDKVVAITVNPLILIFLCYLLYGFAKQWEFFELQRDSILYSEMYTKPEAYSYRAENLFDQFLAQKYCHNETERLYPSSLEERNKLYTEFIAEGWVRPAPQSD